MSSAAAVKRLIKEAKYIQEHPVLRGNALPCGDDLFNWKLIVYGEPPYDFPIRIHLEYSQNYPNTPPKAYFETPIFYTGGAVMRDSNGRQGVCLNIFGNFSYIHTEWKNQQEGWTPGYTIETIILSIQGLMMENMLSKDPSHVKMSRDAALSFKCKETGHDGSDPKKYFPPILFDMAQLPKISSEKSDEETEYVCYVTKKLPEDHLLGFGASIIGKTTKSFVSPCEYMSREAFYDMNVRFSSINKPVDVWFPIITPYKKWNDIRDLFYEKMAIMSRSAEWKFDKVDTPVKICFSIMNMLVVEIMNAKNNLTANDKFIDGYFTLYNLLLNHVNDYPQISEKMDKEIERFVSDKNSRNKNVVSNLGEFILYPLISKKYSWKDISKSYIEECDSRSVFWYVQGTHVQPGAYPELKNKDATERENKVFKATETSRNLICYQKQFSNYAKTLSMTDLEQNRGFVPNAMKESIKNFYKNITAIQNWDQHFEWLEMPKPKDRNSELLTALQISEDNEYHKNSVQSGGNPGYGRGRGRGGRY
jgi:ubiquitin-protein ligase